jgi:glyceraldehyde 3-phosphate dehydrogenase
LNNHYTLNRKFCTLEKSGVILLPYLKDKFCVNYTIVPYDGVSIIDFRFEFNESVNKEEFIADLKNVFYNGILKGIYSIDKADIGPEVHNCTPYSSVFIEDEIKVIGKNVHLFAYFDNENSVNRYFDLTNFIAESYQS